MKKAYWLFSLLIALVVLSSVQTDDDNGCGGDGPRKSGGPPSCYSGEPPLAMTCAEAGCHSDNPINSGTAQVVIDLGGADTGYIPGQTYSGTVSITRTGLPRGGFQLIALKDNDITTTPGVLDLVDNNRTLIINASHPHSGGCATQNKTWIEHTAFGIDDVVNNTISWPFSWQAPATDAGTVTFYLCALDANKDLDNTGDFVYTRTKKISSVVTSVDNLNELKGVSVYPNPVNNVLQLRLPDGFEIADADEAVIVNAAGQTVIKTSLAKAIVVETLPEGAYTLQITHAGKTAGFTFLKR